LIPGQFKSFVFVTTDCKGVTGAFFVTTHSKGLARAAMPEAVNRRDEPVHGEPVPSRLRTSQREPAARVSRRL